MISVTRKTQIPSVAALCCCSSSPNWPARPAGWACASASVTCGLLCLGRICVRLFVDHGNFSEIFRRRRRRRLPFESCCAPGIRLCHGTVAHRPDQIHEWNQIPYPEDRGSRRRHHVKHLKFRGIERVAARHSEIAKNELREKCQVETDKNNRC